MLVSRRPVLALCAMAFLCGGAIYADTVEFAGTNLTNGGGTLVFTTGNSGFAQVKNAYIDQVTNIDTGTNFSVTGTCTTSNLGCLSLKTGAYISTQQVSATIFDVLYSGTGSSLSVTGSAGSASGTLLTDAFTAGSTITLQFNTSTHGGTIQGLLDTGTLDSTLAAALGVSPNTTGLSDNENFFKLRLVLSGNPKTLKGGTGTIDSSALQVASAAVPEPTSVSLLAMMLLGIVVVGRKVIPSLG